MCTGVTPEPCFARVQDEARSRDVVLHNCKATQEGDHGTNHLNQYGWGGWCGARLGAPPTLPPPPPSPLSPSIP